MGKTEQEHHRKAFEVYFSLGAKRSYKEVAKQMGVSPSAVKLWSKSFDWPKRLGERDAEVARRVADRALETQVNVLDRDQKIVHMALMKLAKGIADGQVKMQMGDLDRLIRLRGYLRESQESDNIDRLMDRVAAWAVTLHTDEFRSVFGGKLREAIERQGGIK